MPKGLILSILLVSASVAFAAVKPGENLLINGGFEGEQLNFPMFWEKGGSNTGFNPTGGPGNTGAVVFSNPEGLKGIRSTCRQYDQQILAGETYKMSAYVKTQGFKSNHCGIIVHNNGWYKESGIRSFPETTDGWQYLEQTFKLQESKDSVYGVAIFAVDYVGEIQFAQVKLEAISPAALAGSSASRLLAEQNRPRLVAWEPLLNQIPLADPKMTFRFFGKPEGALTGYECVYTVDGTTVRKYPLARELNIPVVLGSQLSRNVERREDKRPILSDLAESGSIEAEADLVCMLYRESYYQRKKDAEEVQKAAEAKASESREQYRDEIDIAELIVAKHRNGPVGTVKLGFKQDSRIFENISAAREAEAYGP